MALMTDYMTIARAVCVRQQLNRVLSFFLAFHGLSRLEVKKEKEDSFSVFTALRQLGQETEYESCFQVSNFWRITRMLLTHQNKHKFIVFEDDIEYTLAHVIFALIT